MLFDLTRHLGAHFFLFNLIRYLTFGSGAACMTALLANRNSRPE